MELHDWSFLLAVISKVIRKSTDRESLNADFNGDSWPDDSTELGLFPCVVVKQVEKEHGVV